MSLSLALAWSAAGAHSASDAYLTLSVDPAGNPRGATVHGQWDIALRDLDFVMKLDDDGDGELTWGEVKHHQSAIERYAFEQLRFKDETGAACSVKPGRQMIDGHADGTYAVLYFDVVCGRPAKSLTMDYALFFAIDPSHRGIMVMHSGGNTATAVISPQNAKVVLALQ
jgi:hypothetical protein